MKGVKARMRARYIFLLLILSMGTMSATGSALAETSLPMPSAFETCAGCHSVKPAQNFDAPSLAGVYGRRAGTEPGYTYSAAMKNSHILWDAATLDAYLTAPKKVVPNNQMAFDGLPDPRARAEIIRYLRSLSNN